MNEKAIGRSSSSAVDDEDMSAFTSVGVTAEYERGILTVEVRYRLGTAQPHKLVLEEFTDAEVHDTDEPVFVLKLTDTKKPLDVIAPKPGEKPPTHLKVTATFNRPATWVIIYEPTLHVLMAMKRVVIVR